jgi:hypothetical protein
VESLPAYEKGPSLEEIFGDQTDRNHPDFRFASFMDTGLTWADIDHRFPQFRRVRDRIWPPQSDDAEEEMAETTASRVWRRKLYRHQLDSFEQLVRKKRNLVVATATGSGKTECFLLPLLYTLLTEPDTERKTPGVRALLVYPMNALVEDQMHRLRQILFWINLSCQDSRRRPTQRPTRPITFGRYTGNTPIAVDDRNPERQPSDEALEHLGEIVYRTDMQHRPPDILVTNFTMLEYILLRGDDQRLFQRPDLFKFLILDEIHTYTGTQGMEVALLLRRLRAFLEVQAVHSISFQTVGTSATLPSGDNPREKAALFATTLFGNTFAPEDVIRPESTRPAKPGDFTDQERSKLVEVLSALPERCPALAAHLGLTDEPPQEEIPEEEWASLARAFERVPANEPPDETEHQEEADYLWIRLFRLLGDTRVIAQLRYLLGQTENSCLALDELARGLFGDDPRRTRATTALLRMIGLAHRGGEPLLTLRFHSFVNEPALAQICLHPNCGEELRDGWWSKLFVRHFTRCEQCNSFVYPIVLCRRCGFVYLEGWRRQSAAGAWGNELLPEPDEADDQGRYERILFRPVGSGIQAESMTDPESAERRTLCLACGKWMVARDNPNFGNAAAHGCPATGFVDVFSWQKALTGGVLEECLFCEQRWFRDQNVVTPPAASVYGVATVLIEELARGLETTGVRPFESKLISFSDSRQQAAQLAYRFQKTNREFTFRQLVWGAVSETESPLTTPELLDELYDRTRHDGRLRRLLIDDESRLNDRALLRQMLATLLFRESVTAYLTLEAQGLLRLIPDDELLRRAAELATGDRIIFDRLSPEERRGFMTFLLDWGLRYRFAIDSSPGGAEIDWEWLRHWYVVPKKVVRSHAQGASGELSFAVLKATGRNRPYNFCRRLFARLNRGRNPDEYQLVDCHQALFALWDHVLVPQSVRSHEARASSAFLLNYDQDQPDRAVLKLNFDALSWAPIHQDMRLFRCDTCGRISHYSIAAVCPIRDCTGTLREVRAGDLDNEQFSPVRHYRRLVQRQSIRPLRIEEHTAQISARRRQEIERDFRRDDEDGIDVVCGSTTFELGIDLGLIHAVFMSNLPPRMANYRQRAGRAGRRPGMVPFILNYVRQRPHDQYFWTRLRDFIAGPLPVPHLTLSSPEVQERHGHALLVASLLADYRPNTKEPMPLEGPPAGAFVAHALDESTRARWRAILNDPNSRLKRLFGIAFNAVPNFAAPLAIFGRFVERLDSLRSSYLSARETDGAITVLSDYGILPSYAFPLYVDELRLNTLAREAVPRSDLKLQRDRKIALREYMPGRAIVASKTVILSEGIWGGFEERVFWLCTNRECQQMEFRRNPGGSCPHCGSACKQHNAIIPKAGFFGRAVDSVAEQDFELARQQGETYFDPANEPPPKYRSSGRALEVAVVGARVMEQSQSRPRMRQFNPRPAASTELLLVPRNERDLATPNLPPVQCLARPSPAEQQQSKRFCLMHEFTTDIVRIRILANEVGNLLVSSPEFARVLNTCDDPTRRYFYFDCLRRTFAEALVCAGSLLLDIDQSELDVAFHPGSGLAIGKEIILFDTAPGGAGYARQLAESITEVFRTAQALLQGCSCGDSCYGCLRNYFNQNFHKRLNRHFLLDGLGEFNARNWV